MIVLDDFWYSEEEQAFNFIYGDTSIPAPERRTIYTSFRTTVAGALRDAQAWFPDVVIPPSFQAMKLPSAKTARSAELFAWA